MESKFIIKKYQIIKRLFIVRNFKKKVISILMQQNNVEFTECMYIHTGREQGNRNSISAIFPIS